MSSSSKENEYIRKRSAQACARCRSRKVRCDLVTTGLPCTNCRLDRIDCVEADNKRRRLLRFPFNATTKGPPAQPPAQESDHGASSTGARPLLATVDAAPGPRDLFDRTEISESHDGPVPRVAPTRRRQVRKSPTTGPGNRLGIGDIEDGQPAPSLPSYIRKLPSKLTADDLDYISRTGAFEFPPDELYQSCLSGFVEFVHPQLPAFDLKSFLASLDAGSGGGNVSLLLFHAIMFAGVAYADLDVVKRFGWSSRMAARTTFYHKCKVLHDLNAEPDRVASIQAALLMSTWYDKAEDHKDPGYWVGVALSLAHSVGLHLEQVHAQLPAGQRMLWRRIWWSCFIREHIVTLGLGRPARITNYAVPMLTLDDFDLPSVSENPSAARGQQSVEAKNKKQQTLALLFIEKTKLCVVIGHITSAIFIANHPQEQTTSPRSRYHELDTCEKELADWFAALPEEVTYSDPEPGQCQGEDRSLVVIRTLLRLDHLATISTLNRPRALYPVMVQGLSEAPNIEAKAQRLVREAATEITRINFAMYQLGLGRYLSATSVVVLVCAMIIHLLDAKSADSARSLSAVRGFYQCKKVLQVLEITYNSAVQASKFLEAAARSVGLQEDERDHTGEDTLVAVGNGHGGANQTHHAPKPGSSREPGSLTMPEEWLNESAQQTALDGFGRQQHDQSFPQVDLEIDYWSTRPFNLEGAQDESWTPSFYHQRENNDVSMNSERDSMMSDVLGLNVRDDLFQILDL